MREMRISNRTEQVLCVSIGQTAKLPLPHRDGNISENTGEEY